MITSSPSSSAPAGYRSPREVIAVAVRWYLRYGLCYRDVEELLAERGIQVDHVTVYRWVQAFTPDFIDAARPARHSASTRCFVDETYVKVAGRWSYLYRAIDQHGQVIDVLVSQRRDGAAARAFFTRALTHGRSPVEVTTDRAPGVSARDGRVRSRRRGRSWSSMRRMKLSTAVPSRAGVLGRFSRARCSCLTPAAGSRGQCGAPGWTNDLDRGEDRGSVGLRWAWSTAERRAGYWDWKCCRAA